MSAISEMHRPHGHGPGRHLLRRLRDPLDAIDFGIALISHLRKRECGVFFERRDLLSARRIDEGGFLTLMELLYLPVQQPFHPQRRQTRISVSQGGLVHANGAWIKRFAMRMRQVITVNNIQ